MDIEYTRGQNWYELGISLVKVNYSNEWVFTISLIIININFRWKLK